MDVESTNIPANTISPENPKPGGGLDKLLVYIDVTSNRLTYIFDFIIGDLLGLKYELTSDRDFFEQSTDAKFTYAANPVGDEVFYESDPFLSQTDIHPQPINFCEYGDINGFYPVSPRSIIPFDMFASAFFMITRYEEYLPGKKDKYDRYRGKESMNFKGGFLERPMIDLYAMHLRNALLQKFPKLAVKQRQFEYIPTFDIDMAYSYLYKNIRTNAGGFARSILTSDFAEFKDRLLVLMRRRKDPFDSYDYIFKVCEQYRLSPRFFFLVGDRSRFDKNISFNNNQFRGLIKEVSEKADVGIHLSFKSHTSNERMSEEISRLEEITGVKITGNRFHYLRFQIPPSYMRLIKIGLKEHSLGYAGRVGYRAATCTPFPFFNLKHNIKTDFKIYPFAFMDTTFTHYLKQDADIALEKILQLMKSVKRVGGPFVGLWHNSSFSETKEWRGWREIFETVSERAFLYMNENNSGQNPVTKAKGVEAQKWDELVNRSAGSLPYCLSWYLDAVSENWDALVMGDYEVVMPLIWFRKLGVKCLYQPHYCQQTGIFCRKPVTGKTADEFIRFINQKFSYININLSSSAAPVAGEFRFRKKINLILELDKEYKQLFKNYSENHRRNIRKAEKNGYQLNEDTAIKAFEDFYLKNVDRKGEYFKKKHEKIFRAITNELAERNKGKIFTVINNTGTIMAASLIILHQKRVINIVNCSSDEGKKAGASHFLFDGIARKYALSGNTLDFEGSSVPNVARFYKGFGAVEEIFFNYRKHVFQL